MPAPLIKPGISNPLGSSCEILVRRCKQLLIDQGMKPEGMLRANDVHLTEHAEPTGRVSCRSEETLLRDTQRALDNPLLGWELGKIELRDAGLCGFMALNAPDVRTALGTIVEMGELLSENGQYALNVVDGEATLARTLSTGQCLDQVSISFFNSVLRQLIGPDFQATRAALPDRDPDRLARLSHLAETSVVTTTTEMTLISFPTSYLDRPVHGADALLAATLQKLWREEKARIEARTQALQRLQLAILPLLPQGEPKLDHVAGQLAIDTRTLKIELDALGTTLPRIVDRIRAHIVGTLMTQPGMTLHRAAQALGYKEAGSLTRALKRWSGTRPGLGLAPLAAAGLE